METFLEVIHKQAILDTALDYMSKNLDTNGTIFQISRQAAMAGKVAFPLLGDNPLGGVITVEIEGENLGDWLEAATWHSGRENIPRRIGDEFTMYSDGEAFNLALMASAMSRSGPNQLTSSGPTHHLTLSCTCNFSSPLSMKHSITCSLTTTSPRDQKSIPQSDLLWKHPILILH